MRGQTFHHVSIYAPVSPTCALNPVHLASLNQQKVLRVLYATGYVFFHVFGLLSIAGFTYCNGFGVVILWKNAKGNILPMPERVYRLLAPKKAHLKSQKNRKEQERRVALDADSYPFYTGLLDKHGEPLFIQG